MPVTPVAKQRILARRDPSVALWHLAALTPEGHARTELGGGNDLLVHR